MERKPLRILNETSGVFGLTTIDICSLGYVFVLSHLVLEKFEMGIMSFAVTGVTAFALSSLRLNSRAKIIRDSVSYYLGRRVLYSPEEQGKSESKIE